MRITKRLSYLALAGALFAAPACQDLDVPNTNDPSPQDALSSPQTLEALLNSIHINSLYNTTHNSRGTTDWWTAYGEDATVDNTSFGADQLTREPREEILNLVETDFHENVLRPTWSELNEGLSSANDILWAIRIAGVDVLTEDTEGQGVSDNTGRAETLAKFMQAVMRGYIAAVNDVGFEVDEENVRDVIADLTLAPAPTPYYDYIDVALDEFDEAISLAENNDFSMPASRNFWYGAEFTDELVEDLANGFAARLGSSWARTPQEREEDVDWTRVLNYALNGPEEIFNTLAIRENNQTRSYLMWRTERSTSTNFHLRLDYRMVGPADVSGQFQDWWDAPLGDKERFIMTTPDRRITGDDPESNGSYVRFQSSNPFPTTDEPYRASYYQYNRWKVIGGAGENSYRDGPIPIMTPTEMDLIAAEAYIRLGNNQAAADLINLSRVANGELPPVTAAGVPAGADCVPKTPQGACGSLLEALWHERKLELYGLDSWMSWMTNRGFDEGLPCYTATQLPRHNRELVSIGVPTYTFGGESGTFSFQCANPAAQ